MRGFASGAILIAAGIGFCIFDACQSHGEWVDVQTPDGPVETKLDDTGNVWFTLGIVLFLFGWVVCILAGVGHFRDEDDAPEVTGPQRDE